MQPTTTMPAPAVWAILERAIDAGETPLTLAELVGRGGKAGQALLAPLLAQGWFIATKKKYVLTPEGYAVWAQYAAPDRLAAVQAKSAAAQHARTLAFLQLVEAKHGKLSASDVTKWSETLAATLEHLIERGPKANTFVLRPAGEAILLAAKPETEQLAALRNMHAQWQARWDALRTRWQNLPHAALRTAGASIASHVQAALTQLADSTAAADAFTLVAQAARTVHDELRAQHANLHAAEQQLVAQFEQQRAELSALEHAIAERFQAMQQLLTSTAPTPDAAPPADLWPATQRAYRELAEQARKFGGIVNVPELADRVLAMVTLPRATFLQQLLAWERADLLTLQVCNDRHLEPRAAEGIDSPRGLLFYVRIR